MSYRIKKQGGVYTPFSIVQDMLNLMHYQGNAVLCRHIMENSCGEGAFLEEIVNRYCTAFLKGKKASLSVLKKQLETYIHGIELQQEAYAKCIVNLNKIAARFGVYSVNWDIKQANALTVSEYNGKMDFVVGNPPYVRVHHWEDPNCIKKFKFATRGMSDLYLAFFELGLGQLKKGGKLCLITPNSFLFSNAGRPLRFYIQSQRTLTALIDLGHTNPFSNGMSYTVISLFDTSQSYSEIKYKTYTDTKFSVISYKDLFQQGKILPSSQEERQLMCKINCFYDIVSNKKILVKNGFATLADSVFINDFLYDESIFIDVLKASTGKWKKCLFPYDSKGQTLAPTVLKDSFPLAYSYLNENKNRLVERSIEKNTLWFAFGRTQAIKDVPKYKVAINTLIKDLDSIKIQEVPAGAGVYSGLYILSPYSFDQLYKVIYNKTFLKYIHSLKKYKSGGYVTFSSKDLEKYLVYMLQKGDDCEFKC